MSSASSLRLTRQAGTRAPVSCVDPPVRCPCPQSFRPHKYFSSPPALHVYTADLPLRAFALLQQLQHQQHHHDIAASRFPLSVSKPSGMNTQTVPIASSPAPSLFPGQHGKMTFASRRRHSISPSTASFSEPSLPLSRSCCQEFGERNTMAGGIVDFRRIQRRKFTIQLCKYRLYSTSAAFPKTSCTPVHDVVKVGFDVAYMFIPARIYDSVSHLTQLSQLIPLSHPPSLSRSYTARYRHRLQEHLNPTGFSPRLGWGWGDWLSKFSNLLEAAESKRNSKAMPGSHLSGV